MNVFFGSYHGILEAMDALTPVDVVICPRGRLRHLRLEHRLRQRGVRWLEVSDRREFIGAIEQLPAAQFCAVAGFSFIIPAEFIERSHTIINFHPGDLFCCRGPQPLESALIQGHRTLGACAHRIDSEELDAGPLLARELIEVDPERDFGWHKRQLLELLAAQAGTLFGQLAAGTQPEQRSWPVTDSTYYPRPLPEELKKLYTARSIRAFHDGWSETSA